MWNLLYLFLVIDECSVLGMNVFFPFLSHIFQILDIVLCPSNTIAFQEKKTPFPWIYFLWPRALFHHGFNSSLFKSLIRQSIFKMLFDNHVSLLMAYPKNYSCCCEICTCLHLLKAAVILTNIRYLLLNYLCSFLLYFFWGFIFIFKCFLKSFTTIRTSYL